MTVNNALKLIGEKIYLKKASALIAIDNQMTQTQRRAFNVMLLLAIRAAIKDPLQQQFECSLTVLRQLIGYTVGGANGGVAKKTLHTELLELQTKKFEANLLGKDDNPLTASGWLSFSLFSELRFSDDRIQYAFPPTLRDQMFKPKPYATIDLKLTRGLNRPSLAIYELCCDYSKAQLPDMPVETLLRLLGCGPRWRTAEFLKKILEPAIQAVTDGTNFAVAVKYTGKVGKRVTRVKITIETKEAVKAVIAPTLAAILASIPPTERQQSVTDVITMYVASHGPKYVAENLAYTLSRNFDELGAYLTHSLKKDLARKNRDTAAASAKKLADAQAVRDKVAQEKEATKAARQAGTKASQRRQLEEFYGYAVEKQQQILDYFIYHHATLGMEPFAAKVAFYFSTQPEFDRYLTERDSPKPVEAIEPEEPIDFGEFEEFEDAADDLVAKPTPSTSGKTLVVASTRGNAVTTAEVDGKPITIGLPGVIAALVVCTKAG